MPSDDDEFAYFTQRSIYVRGDARKKNWGTTNHKVKVWVFKDEPEIANLEYKCPYCDHQGLMQVPWVKPLKFECQACGKKISVPKLK